MIATTRAVLLTLTATLLICGEASAGDAKTRALQDAAEHAAAKARRAARDAEPAPPRRVPGADEGPLRVLPSCVERHDPEERRRMQSEDDSCLPAGPLARERLILRATELREGGAHKMVGGWLTFGAGVVGVAAIAAARQCVLDCEPLSKARQAIVALSATAIIGGLIIAVVGHADRGLSRRLMERVRAAPLLSRGRVTGAALGLVLPF